MTCDAYPVYKACNFLAINYYDQISNCFEDYLTEALIPENSFFENENSNTLGNIDSLYRSPWQKIQCDEKFLSDEAAKAEESISEIGVDTSLNLDEPSWLHDNDDCFHNVKISEKETSIFDEKDFEVFKENTLDGKFQLLDVPYIPFNLSSIALKRPLLTDLLKKLPSMEVDDAFKDDFNFPFEDMESFFDMDLEDTDKELSLSSTENLFKELPLPDLPDEEDNLQDIVSVKTLPESMKSSQCQGSSTDKISDNVLIQPQNSFEAVQSDCDGDNKLKHNNDEFENSMERETNDEANAFPLESVSALNSKNTKENILRDHNAFYGLEKNVNSGKNPDNLSLLEHSTTDDTALDFDSENFHSEWDVDELITEIAVSSQTDEKGRGYEARSFLNDDPEFCSDFHNLDSEIRTDSCTQNNFTFEEDLTEQRLEKNVGIANQGHFIIDASEKKSYIEKISKLTFEKRINEKNETKGSCVFPDSSPYKNFKSYTAVRKDRFSHSPLSSMSNQHLFEGQALLETCSSSKTVNLLSNFLSIPKLSQSNCASTSKCNFTKSYLKGKENEDSVNTFTPKSNLSTELSISKNDSPQATVFEFKVEDVLVKIPDEMIKIAQIYEANAVPLLLSLLQSDKFKFPPKFTIADISPCKTCFLLNQEAKLCRDNNVSFVKDRKGGKRPDYYTQLLAFHGLLKSFECFIHFDVQLAASNLLEFEERHLSLLKGCYDTFIEAFKTEMNKCPEITYVHPKLNELSKFLKEKLSLCKKTGQIFKVMIIIKKYLSQLYKIFESLLKEEMYEVKTFLIPESVFLHENTLMFKSLEDTVYFVSPTSLAKNIPWKDLILIIEFQHDNNSCWKHICSEKNIPHAFVQVTDLPLKSLGEIQKLKTPDKPSVLSVQDPVKSLVVSSSITSQYQLLYLLESRLKFSICIRNYKEILPHLHFADIALDEKSALILASKVSFLEDDFPKILCERVSFLLLKYEVCWIIVQECKENVITLKHMKSNENLQKCFLLTEDLHQKSTAHKVKMLHAHSIEQTLDLIKSIILRNFNSHPVSIDSQISKFFHSTLHKVLPSESDASDESAKSTPDSDHELNSESNSEFKLRPNYHKNSNASRECEDSEEEEEEANDNEGFLDPDFANIGQDCDRQRSCFSRKAIDHFSSDKTLEELDLDYMSLKLSHEYDSHNDYLDEDRASLFNDTKYPKIKCAVVSPIKNKYPVNDYSYNFESLNCRISSRKKVNDCDKSLMKLDNRLDYLGTSSRVAVGRETIPSSVLKMHNSQNPPLDLEKFRYTSKRKCVTESSPPNNDCLLSPALKKSCRIQKGMISKIVSKKDLSYTPSCNSPDVVSCDSGNVRKAKVSPFMKRGHCFEDSSRKIARGYQSENDVDIYFDHQQSQWSDSSLLLNSFPMTPATRKLGFEKMPGVKGQTRLVFQ